jgi:BirA family biotin operon repressor/biotin-[acetyl-CoA-carboxylase] ligase
MFSKGKWFFFDTIDSTNSKALQMASLENVGEGSVVVANYQQKGRGQRGNEWQSNANENLLMSLILYPSFLPPKKIFLLNQVIALAVYDVVAAYCNQKINIKWPNDIMMNDKKIAGILIENSFRGDELANSVAGVGLNVNQRVFDNFNLLATSLSIASTKNYEIIEVARTLQNKIEFWYSTLKHGNFQLIDEFYHGRLYRLNEFSKFKINNETVLGTIRGVAESGKLLFEKENREILKLDNKEIEFVF